MDLCTAKLKFLCRRMTFQTSPWVMSVVVAGCILSLRLAIGNYLHSWVINLYAVEKLVEVVFYPVKGGTGVHVFCERSHLYLSTDGTDVS